MTDPDRTLMSAPFQCHEQIRAHVEQYIGRIEQVHEDAATAPSIRVLHVLPTDARPVHTLITSGMSDYAMRVPPGKDAPQYLELMVTLPEAWPVADLAADKLDASWPLRELYRIARLPQRANTWIGWGQTQENGIPPMPFAPATKQCGVIIAPSLMVPPPFYELEIGAQKIAFFSLIPLYREELELHGKLGMEALLSKLIDAGIKDLIDPKRRNVAKRFFGLF